MISTGKIVKIMLLMGISTVLGSFFLLPWVSFADSESADMYLADPRIFELMKQVPFISEEFKNQQPGISVQVSSLFSDPNLQRLYALAREKKHLTGWEMWHDAPVMGGPLRLVLLLCVVMTVLVILWSIAVPLVSLQRVSMLVTQGFILCMLLLILMLLWYLPTLDILGIQDDFGIALLSLVTGAQPDIGIWVGICGLMAVVISKEIEFLVGQHEDLSNGNITEPV